MQRLPQLGLLVVGVVVVLVVGAVWFAGRAPDTAESATAEARREASERGLEAAPLEAARETATQRSAPPDEVPSGHALLQLRVVAHEGGAPVADSEWRLVETSTQPETHAELAEAIRSFGPSPARTDTVNRTERIARTDAANHAELIARTDAEGRAQFIAPAGIELKLVCVAPDDVEQLVPPLAEREIRELTLRIGPTADDWFVARVVDAQTKQPIEGVEFLPLSRFAVDLDTLEVGARSDERGEVRIDVRVWSPFDALVRARGYGLCAIPVRVDRERPHVELALVRGGPLEVRIDGSKGLRYGMQVNVLFARRALFAAATSGESEQRMFATLPLDEALRTEFASPPLDAEIDVLARIRPHAPVNQTVRLAAGDTRSVQFDFKRHSAIVGTVHTDDPAAAVGVTLVLRRVADLPEPAPSEIPELGARPIAVVDPAPRFTTTDESGAFRFDDLAPGDWSLGTEDAELRRLALTGTPRIAQVAPRRLRLLGDGVELKLKLDATVGWMIAGRVVDFEGNAVADAIVGFTQADDRNMRELARTGDDGAFHVGPFEASRVTLAASLDSARSARLHSLGYGGESIEGSAVKRSAPVEFNGPTSNAVLRLPRGGRICGTLGSTTPAGGIDFKLVTDSGYQALFESIDAPATFCFEGLVAGRYHVLVHSRGPDDGIGLSSAIELAEGASIDGVEIALSKPARLSLRAREPNSDPIAARFYGVVVDGAPVGVLSADPPHGGRSLEPSALPIPPGRVTVWAVSHDPALPEQLRRSLFAEFDLAAGESRVLEDPR